MMNAKWRYILGTVTIVTIVGGTIYAIKKAKDLERQEEQAISVEEAQAIAREAKEDIQEEDSEEVITVLTTAVALEDSEEQEEVIHIRKPILVIPGDEEDEDEYPDVDEQIEGPILTVEPLIEFSYIEEGIDNPKEDKTLRFEQNSDQAKHQYIRMELADWEPSTEVYQILLRLFEIPFIPMNDGDDILRTQIIDYKVQFFGWGSKWNREVSFAEVILHYAKAAEYNCGESVAFWAEHFLYSAGFRNEQSSEQFDIMIMRLNSHSHFNDHTQTFSLFGFNRQRADECIKLANRNIDRAVTYEIEFNEFLKACINEELHL